MNTSNWSVSFLNKCLVPLPFVLLHACDGGRGNEGTVALGATFLLAIVLTWLERRYALAVTKPSAFFASACCALSVILILTGELVIFKGMKMLQGPVGSYGILPTMTVLSIVIFGFACLTTWADQRRL